MASSVSFPFEVEAPVLGGRDFPRRLSSCTQSFWTCWPRVSPGGYWTGTPLPLFFVIWRALEPRRAFADNICHGLPLASCGGILTGAFCLDLPSWLKLEAPELQHEQLSPVLVNHRGNSCSPTPWWLAPTWQPFSSSFWDISSAAQILCTMRDLEHSVLLQKPVMLDVWRVRPSPCRSSSGWQCITSKSSTPYSP